ncbi:MAG: DUF1501 domain-containing protein [Gemmataceae bacterium]
MLRLDLGTSGRYCDGGDRRSFLQVGAAGLAALGLPDLLRAKATAPAARRDTAVILIWLDGGPSHLDMYDMKPDAPAEYRGIWKPVRTKVPGFDITELFPKQAQVTDKFSVVRSLHHGTGDHFAGGHRMLTTKEMGVSGANTDQRFPGIGSIVSKELGPRKPGMPAYVAAPHAASIGLAPGYFGGHFLGRQYDPFIAGDPSPPNYQVPNLNPAAGLTVDRLDDRRTLLARFDKTRATLDRHPAADTMDRFTRAAFDFVTGPAARAAFDLSKEDPKLRDRYGRDGWGQSTLLARRLVEAGSTFVNVHLGGWDHHWDLKKGYENYLPKVDAAVSTLFTDLADRGLLDTTLVVLCGEFSRTPKMNDGGNGGPAGSMGTPGRDHWGQAMFCLFGGGGVKGGRVVGSTDRRGERPSTRPVTPSNVHATIYRVLGIDPKLHLMEPTGRPAIVLDDPEPIAELF